MSVLATGLPKDFPLVGLGLGSLFFFNLYQMLLVSKARKESGVSYPYLYASDAEAKADIKKLKFNCVQRSHQNTLENVPFILALTLFLGAYHPRASTLFVHFWIFGRWAYTSGYATGDPKKRNNALGRFHYLGLAGLLFTSLYVGLTHVKAIFL